MSSARTVPLHPPSAPGALTPQLQAQIERVFALQRETALRLRSSTISERIARLKRLRATILAHRDSILDAATRDFRRPAAETEFTELMPVLTDISDHCRQLKKWLKPRRMRSTMMMMGTEAWVRYEPRGRCLIIAPWNYPVTLTLGPLVPAIACGNAVIVKTSEVAPAFSAVLVRIIRECFDESEVAVFEGDASVASALLALPFDHCFFTGAPAIGKIVMAAASQHLTSVTLELGGKSPVIVDASADLDLAAATIAWAKHINSGQTCVAPDHIYVHRSIERAFVDRVCANLERWYGNGAPAKQAELARVINARHTQRVKALLDDATQRGGRVVFGGAVDVAEHFVSPTVLADVPSDARVMQEEIFGPLLPIIPYDDIDEVIARINDAPKPLALYIWARDAGLSDRIIERTSAGGTCINHVAAQFLHHNLPFGGVNNSGIGSYHGEWGIRAFSHERAVLKTRVMLVRMFFPPYTPRVRKVLDLILKYL